MLEIQIYFNLFVVIFRKYSISLKLIIILAYYFVYFSESEILIYLLNHLYFYFIVSTLNKLILNLIIMNLDYSMIFVLINFIKF